MCFHSYANSRAKLSITVGPLFPNASFPFLPPKTQIPHSTSQGCLPIPFFPGIRIFRKPSKTQGKRIRFLKRTMVEKNGQGIKPSLNIPSAAQKMRAFASSRSFRWPCRGNGLKCGCVCVCGCICTFEWTLFWVAD